MRARASRGRLAAQEEAFFDHYLPSRLRVRRVPQEQVAAYCHADGAGGTLPNPNLSGVLRSEHEHYKARNVRLCVLSESESEEGAVGAGAQQ